MSSEKILIHPNNKNEITELKSSIKTSDYKVQCSIVKHGLTKAYANYYLCECDPERKNPICENCFKECHKGNGHAEIKMIQQEKICMCGIKSHQPFNENENLDNKYSKKCLFGEWAIECKYKVCFKDKDNDIFICLLCKNICYKNLKKLTKINIDEESRLNNKTFECQCTNNNHNDIRIMFRKFKSISKGANYYKKYNFDGFSIIQLFNLITRGTKSFNNIFHSFKDKINDVLSKIKSNPKYRLEEFKNLNDLHLTSQILSNFAIKSKNVYFVSPATGGGGLITEQSRKSNSNLNLPSFFNSRISNKSNLSMKKSFITGGDLQSDYFEYNSNNLYISCKSLVYFREDIKNFLTPVKYFQIMQQKFDYKSHNIWKLKYFLTNIFYSYRICRDFIKYPNLKYKDIFLLNPLQRLGFINNIKNQNNLNEYFQSENNILDNVLNVMAKISKTKEKHPEIYLIYNKLYKICQFYSKFSLFNHEQVEKFCNINNEILLFFNSCILEDKKIMENQHLKYKVISPMMKSIVYLAYYFNDQVLLSTLKNEKSVNFLHMKNEMCKLLMNNVENCLTWIQDLTPQYEIENYQKDIENKQMENKNNIKKSMRTFMDKDFNQNNSYEDINIKKCLRNVVRCANSILNLIFALADNYIVGMNRLIHKTGENQFNYVLGNFNEKEKNFIKNVENIFEEFEFEYFKQFDLYNENSYDLLSIRLNELLEKVCVECGLEKNKNNNNNNNNNNNLEDGKNLIENFKLLNAMNIKPKKRDGSVYKLFFEHEKPSKFNENNIINEDDIKKILLNNTFIMPTIFKGIQILYNFFFSRNQKNKFFLDKELFNRILNLSYFYISNNLDNSYMFLTSDFLSSIELLNNEQLYNMLDVVEYCLKQIYFHSMEISCNTQIIHLLKICVVKSTKSVDLIDKILKIMQIIIHINFNDEQNTLKKLRKLFIKFYDKCKEANVDLKMLLNGKDKIHHYKTIKKLLRILNHLFEGNAILEERRFIEELLNRRDFKKILRYNLTLDISIRTELLVLYRIINIDTIMMKGKINYYTSFLINEPKVPKTDGFIDNQKYLRFYENLITGGILELTGHRSDKCCNYLFELQNFKNIINRAQHNNYVKTKDYFERGILKPILVFRSKFSSLVFNCSGIDYLRYYLLLVFFLRLKIYIIEHKDSLNFKEERKKFKNPFKNKLDTWGKKKRGIINFDFSSDAYKKVNEDYENANNLNFKLVYFYVVNDYFQKNINKFINETKYNKGMKDTFEKKSVVYEDDEIDKKKEYLESMNLLNSEFQKNIFEIIIKYYNGKTEIEKSSFFKILAEDNIYYNCKFRFIVVKNILFFMNNFIYESTYREQSMWNLFRLLQYDTSETQKSCLELLEKKSSLLDFNYFLSDFTLHVMTIFTKDLNPCEHMIRHDYFITLMIIKILKYFCEEHNQDFQRIFFIKEEEDGIVLHYNPKLYEIESLRPIFLWRTDESGKNPNILNSSDEEEETENETLINGEYNNISFNVENVRNKKPVPDEDCENFHEVTRSEENLKEFTKNKASVFEYCLSILGKIILVSNWINNKETEELDDYYYDLYFVILEFLIETIQGTRGENLQTVFVKDSNGKHLFGTFLLDINRLMIEENDDELSYQVRKDMMDFLMAFIEESATPPEGIVEISSVILPISILESILITMSKLYESKKEEEKVKNNNKNEIKNKIEDSLENSHTLTNQNVYSFTPEMKKYFMNLFFNDLEFGEDIKFSLANRMYQFFKFFGIEDAFKNPAVSEFYEKMSFHTEAKIIKSYYLNKNSSDKSVGVTDPKFFDNYLCVSFFESITKMVFVYKVGNEKPVRVLFTLNPLVPLLSMNSKIDFIENVDRSNRYNKLFSLTESCDYFFEEVNYKQNHVKNNMFMRFITELDFYYVDFLSFIVTLVINIILVSVIKGDGERIFGDQKMKRVINGLGLFNLCINLLSLIFWCLGKFPLFYLTECQKILKQKENEKDEDDDENTIELNFMDKIYATYIVLVLKNKIFGFVWNISFSAAGFITEIYFLYIFQLYSIITLSVTLKNLIFSVVYKFNQLMSVFYLTTILNFIFSGIAFFHFSRDFIREIPIRPPYNYPNSFDFLYEIIGSPYQEPAHAESECGTLLYCFATHLDYGMRFDGGIADRMQAASFTYKRVYYLSRFLYEDFYFICLVILMLNMIFGIIIEAFGDLRQKEQQIDKDKTEICFICGVDKDTLEKRGEKLEVHTDKVHNVWTYVDYMLGLRFVDIQETNAINSYVMENLERKELIWFPYDEVAMENAQQNEY